MRGVAFVAAGLAVCAASAAADPKAEKARADKLFDDGRKYLATKEYSLACTAFEESEKADPAIGTQLNIALCYEEWGHVTAAYKAYVDAERVASAKKDNRAAGARKKVDELGPKVPHLQITLPAELDPSMVVLVDGAEVPREALATELALEIGPHKIEGRVAGRPPRNYTIDLKAGDHEKLTVDVPKPVSTVVAPPPAPVVVQMRRGGKFYAGIALVGVGAVALGIAGGVGLHERSAYGDAIGDCPMLQCSTEAAYHATENARDKANQMTYVAGAGIAAVAVGVVLIVTSHRHAVTPAPMVAPGVVGLSIGGSL
jgi:hypothetical protein